jgi:thioesterase domain-containing protein
MIRKGRFPVAIALSCAVAGVVLTGCEGSSTAGASLSTTETTEQQRAPEEFTGTRKIDVDGRSVNVSCSGSLEEGQPVIMLLHGGGDGLDKFADLQKTLGEQNRVCSYDRLGAGASDKPDGPQSFDSTGRVLTGLLERVAGDAPVILAGHSLGGLIAGRYAPEHQDRIKGVVLMDTTSPTQIADLNEQVPETATGVAVELRDQTLTIFSGQNPEQLVVKDGPVESAGDIPVEVIQHGKQYLAAVPDYGTALEKAWAEGQQKWLALSTNSNLSTATNSEHYVYLDEPDVAVQAIQRVASKVADQG